MKRIISIFLSLLIILPLAAATRPEDVPNVHVADSTRFVSNPDNVLSAEAVARLDKTLAGIWRSTSAEPVVVVIDEMDPSMNIDDFATELFNLWGIGKKDNSNGLLFLVSKGDRRAAIRRAHSATHLLDAALVKVLGDHVHQAGSLVEPDRLRFDFTHFEGITPKQLDEVEDMVNDAILSGLLITTEELPIAEAKARGAVATFGEKYGQTVRVVTMGDFSMELCGGTHLDNTAKAGPFRIKSESSVASGVRRIEATTGKVTMEDMRRSRGLLNRASQFFKSAPETLMERLEQQASEMKALRQALEKFKSEASMGEAKQILASAKTVDGLHVITGTRQGLDANALRLMGDFLRDKDPHVVGVLASIVGEKVTFLAVCGKEAVARGVKAGDLVRTVSAVCGGKGGGKPDSAMGGGTELLKVDDALAAVDDFVAEKLK